MNSITPKIDIRPDHWEIVRDILHKHVPDYEVWAFGSRAKWTAKQYSDLDLAVITHKPLSLEVSANLSDDFSESDLPWKVDIVDWATTQDNFREIIKRDKVVVQKAKNLGMSFNTDSLESMCELIVDCPHSTPEWTDDGVIVLRNQNIKNGNLDLSSPSYTTQKDFEGRIKRAAPTEGDIVLTREAPMGEVCRIPKGIKCCLGQRQVLLRPKKGVDGDYLFWALQSPFVQNQIAWSEGTGSTVSNLRIPLIKALKIPRFDRSEKNIGKILNGLWKKIHLNSQTNQTLESIAQAIFKSWFVDFEPVKAKMAVLAEGGTREQAELAAMGAISGKGEAELAQLQQQNPEHYQQLAETAALFPSAMLDSELGEIPEGWEVKALDEVAHYQNGLALQNFRPDSDDYLPVLKIAQLKKGYADGEEKASPSIKPECIVDNSDVVFSWSGSLMVDVWCGGKVALNQHLFKVTSKTHPKWAYYYFTKHHLADFQRIASDKAVTMGHIKREHLSEAKCALPKSDNISSFTKYIEPLIEKQISLRLETFKLAEIRDSLLPKLLSGEIDLSDIQSEVA